MEPLFPDLRLRYLGPEDMDLPGCDPEKLARTLRLFAVGNPLISASRLLINRHIFSVMKQRGMKSARVVDIGAGGCDIAAWMVRAGKRRGLTLSVTAIDRDSRTLSVGKKTIRGLSGIELVTGDWSIITDMPAFDFAFSNHTLHHIDNCSLEALCGLLLEKTIVGFVLNDLRRRLWAYAIYYVLSNPLSRASLVHRDGLLSIRKGFTPEEFKDMVRRKFPGSAMNVITAFPARIALVWQREEGRLLPMEK